jgi:hypothetical protein
MNSARRRRRFKVRQAESDKAPHNWIEVEIKAELLPISRGTLPVQKGGADLSTDELTLHELLQTAVMDVTRHRPFTH